MKKIVAVLTLLSVLLMLTSCGIVKYEYTDGGLIKKGSQDVFHALPIGFEPCGIGEKCGEFGEFSLYRVLGLNGEEISDEWITEEYSGSATTVFYKGNIPAFREIEFDVCYICEEDTGIVSVATIQDENEINKVISSLDNNEKALWPRNDISETYTLKFYSQDFPAVFYSLTYCVCESGNYIYDRAEQNCVNVGDLLSDYIQQNKQQ